MKNNDYLDNLDELIIRYPKLVDIKSNILDAFNLMRNSVDKGGKIIVGGNGGSAADSDHIVGELVKGFRKIRALDSEQTNKLLEIDSDIGSELASNLQQGIPAISLSDHTALSTAFLNDVNGALSFAQQMNVYGNENDVFLAITTSGNSKNIIYAAVVAKSKQIPVICLTGNNEGKMSQFSDVTISAPEDETFKIQEYHLPIYHCLCLMLEDFYYER